MALPFLNRSSRKLDQVLGIDLGARQTKAVHLQRKSDRLLLLAYAVQEAPARDKGGELLGDHLKSLMKAMGEKTRTAALAVGVPEAFVRHAELPPMPISDMRQLLRLNSKTYLQQDYPECVFDCALILKRAAPEGGLAGKAGVGSNAGSSMKQRVLVGGTKRQTVDDLKTACRVAGLSACQIAPGMLGPVNAFEVAQPEAFAKEVVALVDIGLTHTTICILRQGELSMSRVVTIGGEQVTTALSESLGISGNEAESIKLGMAGEVRQNIEPAIAALGRELRASVDFFEHQHDVAVSQVFLSGGSARSEVFVGGLQVEMMVPCHMWNPAKHLHPSLPPEQRAGLEEAAPQLGTAIGAALSVL